MNALTAPPALNVLTRSTVLHHSAFPKTPMRQGLTQKLERGITLKRIFVHTSCWLFGVTVALTSPLTHATETSASAASALKVLSMPLTETRGDATSSPGQSSSTVQKNAGESSVLGLSITVQKGESIDAVIRRGLPRLPLKDDFLRQALAKANPKIFPKGQTYPVKPGTVLMLPSLDDLRQMITVQYPEIVTLLQKPSSESTPDEAPKGPDKRQWVRFP